MFSDKQLVQSIAAKSATTCTVRGVAAFFIGGAQRTAGVILGALHISPHHLPCPVVGVHSERFIHLRWVGQLRASEQHLNWRKARGASVRRATELRLRMPDLKAVVAVQATLRLPEMVACKVQAVWHSHGLHTDHHCW